MHDEATIREALSRLTAAAWHQRDPERPKACFSIPADPERDADLILGAAIDELASLRTQLAAATERYERAVALHEEARGRLCERLALTPEERATVKAWRRYLEGDRMEQQNSIIAIIDRIAPPPAGQGGK